MRYGREHKTQWIRFAQELNKARIDINSRRDDVSTCRMQTQSPHVSTD